MKNLIAIFVLATALLFSCKQENKLSELEQRKHELESKKQELQDKKAIAALEEELKTVDAEIKTLNKSGKVVAAKDPASPTGTITGAGVVMRASGSVQAEKLGNFSKGEKVDILSQTTVSQSNEAIANKDIPLYEEKDSGEFAYTLPKGKAVVVDNYNGDNGVYTIHYQHPEMGTLYAQAPAGSLDRLSGELWYFVRRSNGDKGWVVGKFLSVN